MVIIYIYNLDHFLLNMEVPPVHLTTSKFLMETHNGAPRLQERVVSGKMRHVRSTAAEGFFM